MSPSVESLLTAFKTLKGRVFYDPLCRATEHWIETSDVVQLNALLQGIDPTQGAAPYNCVAVLRNVYCVRSDLVEYWPLVERVEAYLPKAVGTEMMHKYLRGGLVKRPVDKRPERSDLGYSALGAIMARVDAARRMIINDEDHEVALQHLERRRKEGATVAELDADPALKALAQAHGIHTWSEFER